MKRVGCQWRVSVHTSRRGAASAKRHQDNEGSRSSDGHGRMHDDTQRAMIRVAAAACTCATWTAVRRAQQRQAHQHHPRKSNWIAAATT